ncbi:MAG: hypothetical protein IKE70_03645 [Bacilli bacterium]|nr:hypothetical protein [Bacilli bacterium]
MKKRIMIVIGILFLVGCNKMNTTPTMTVSNFFQKYQNLDNEIRKSLKNLIKKENMTKEEQEEYKSLLEKQYQNLSFKIKKEETYENNSLVEVEIDVLNYQNAKQLAKEKSKDKETSFIKEQLKEMKQVKDKIKYTLTIYLEKKNDTWIIKKLTDEDLKKIHGIYD